MGEAEGMAQFMGQYLERIETGAARDGPRFAANFQRSVEPR